MSGIHIGLEAVRLKRFRSNRMTRSGVISERWRMRELWLFQLGA